MGLKGSFLLNGFARLARRGLHDIAATRLAISPMPLS